ncbi:MAG: SAR2788 family putative toxin [Bacillota bacterium]
MKKLLVKILIITLLFSILPQGSLAATEETVQPQGIDLEQAERSLSEEHDINLSEQVKVELKEDSDEKLILDMKVDEQDLKVDTELTMDLESQDAIITGSIVDESGNEYQESYHVVFHEVDDEILIATLIDTETGEEYEINSTTLQASVIPIIVGVVLRLGIKYAIKKFGKTAVKNALKQSLKKKWSADDLKSLPKADQNDIKKMYGTASDAWDFFNAQVSSHREVSPGVFVGKDKNGVTFTYRKSSKSGPPTIDVNGIKGVRKIKFL